MSLGRRAGLLVLRDADVGGLARASCGRRPPWRAGRVAGRDGAARGQPVRTPGGGGVRFSV